jgi:hypothetical protein
MKKGALAPFFVLTIYSYTHAEIIITFSFPKTLPNSVNCGKVTAICFKQCSCMMIYN